MRGYLLLLLSIVTISTCFAQKECASQVYFQHESYVNPALVKKIQEIETFINNRLYNNEPRMSPAGATGNGFAVIKIPIIVHVIYNTEEQKITVEQVRSQIEVLNKDFRKLNPGASNLPDYFKVLAADCFIEFRLATIDPYGKSTTGIIWKKTNTSSFGSDDRIKFSTSGGDDAWDASQYLNIWVGKLSAGMVGYSSSPGSVKEKDGIVLKYTAFGTTGTVIPPYNLGRTAVHEIGHWLGLKHIWGDRYCGDDLIADTPPQKGATPGCPSGTLTSCDNSSSGSMYMNYMDVTHDACTSMFTHGQRDRMRALFEDGGPRHSFLLPHAPAGPLLPVAIELPTDTVNGKIISIFPNPAASMITIKEIGRNDLSGERITIHNHLGQMVMQAYFTSKSINLYIGSLQSGLYFIRVGKDKVQKLIKRPVH